MERTRYTWIHGRTGLLFAVFSLVLTSIQGNKTEWYLKFNFRQHLKRILLFYPYLFTNDK